MPQTKTIRIFLGSSITELHYERLHLADYLMNSVRPIFKQDGIEVEVVKCEDIRTGNTGKSSQDEIDDKIKESDISVFIFKEKAGKDTIHEFDVARKIQKTKDHEIYVYCFDIPKEARSSELIAFQERLEKQKKNKLYWKTCKDITDLESQFVIGLLTFERQLLGMKPTTDIEQESITEKDGDALFKKYEQNEQAHEKTQAPLRKEIHHKIDDLLQQTETVMENKDETIAERIFKVIELYKKADRWAEATAYDKEKYSDLLFGYARFLYDYGLYKDAESIYLRQIPLAEESYGKEHENAATSYNEIGLVYWRQGDYGKALEYYQKALAIYEKVLGTEHPFTATSYNNIGLVYDAQGDYSKALEYYIKALKIKEKVFGTEHPDTASSYNNIGSMYYEMKEYPKALEYLGKALVIRKSKLGDEHPDTRNTQRWIV